MTRLSAKAMLPAPPLRAETMGDLMAEEAPTEAFEHVEHAEHAAHSGDNFLARVSVTIAVLAVVAATLGSLESIETAATISTKNASVLFQNKATDQWNFYQAKSIKKNLYEIAAASNAEKSEEFKREAKRYDDETKDILKDAKEQEHKSEEMVHESDHHEHRHHILTVAVTFLHISIAIATISIITKGHRWPYIGALLLGTAGVLTTIYAYL